MAKSLKLDVPKSLAWVNGDGRKQAPQLPRDRIPTPNTSFPMPTISVSTVRVYLRHLEKSRHSGNHSSLGVLVPYAIAYCEAKGYSYRLTTYMDGDRIRGHFLEITATGVDVSAEYVIKDLGLLTITTIPSEPTIDTISYSDNHTG